MINTKLELSRRAWITGLVASAVASPADSASQTMTVLKTSGCGCCLGWAKRMQTEGFEVTARNVAMGELMKFKLSAGLRAELASCHTGKIAEYIVEGHVPAREVRRLLTERPPAIGLAVPGMPVGSPGMSGTADGPLVVVAFNGGQVTPYGEY